MAGETTASNLTTESGLEKLLAEGKFAVTADRKATPNFIVVLSTMLISFPRPSYQLLSLQTGWTPL